MAVRNRGVECDILSLVNGDRRWMMPAGSKPLQSRRPVFMRVYA